MVHFSQGVTAGILSSGTLAPDHPNDFSICDD